MLALCEKTDSSGAWPRLVKFASTPEVGQQIPGDHPDIKEEPHSRFQVLVVFDDSPRIQTTDQVNTILEGVDNATGNTGFTSALARALYYSYLMGNPARRSRKKKT